MFEECTDIYNDDARTISNLLEENWSLGVGERPSKFYYVIDRIARNNIPGSIFTYVMGYNQTNGGINYDGVRTTQRVSIDIQNPENRERHYMWINEVLRILAEYRRAGREQLNGWDRIEPPSISHKTGYVNYYHSVIEITLVREFKGYTSSGFGHKSVCETDESSDGQFD